MALVLIEVVRALRDAGIAVEGRDLPAKIDGHGDGVLDIVSDDHHARFVAETKKRAPFRGELERLQPSWAALSRVGRPLLVVPFVSEALGVALSEAGWSWADTHGNFDLRAPALWLRQRRMTTAPPTARTSLPLGSGSLAIIRTLIRGDAQRTVTGLAAQTGISQPRASQVLRQLRDLGLIDPADPRPWGVHRAELLDRFLGEYRGPGGSELYFYTLDPITEAALNVQQADSTGGHIAVSADVGPDLIAPWRRPSILILYVNHLPDLAGLGLVEAQGKHDANVIVRIPADMSVFPEPPLSAQASGRQIMLADPAQQIWDTLDLGGSDRMEVAHRLREWLLARH